MSLFNSPAQCLARVRLASGGVKSTPLSMRKLPTKHRWNSSKASNSKGREPNPRVAKKASSGWSTNRVLLLAAVVGGVSFAAATLRAANDRDYSRPTKFTGPKFATVKDMEAVSGV